MRFVSSDSVTVTSASADESPSSRSTSGFVPSAPDDGRLRQECLHDAAARRVALNDRRVDAHPRQLQRQPLGDTAAADNDNALGFMAEFADLTKELMQLMRRADHGDIVPGGEHKIAVRDRHAALALHGTDQDALAVAAAKIIQAQAIELTALAQLELDKLHEPGLQTARLL